MHLRAGQASCYGCAEHTGLHGVCKKGRNTVLVINIPLNASSKS